MTDIRPFKAYRPIKEKAHLIAALPYDVYNRQESKAIVKDNPLSFLAIDRAETSFDDGVDTYADEVYAKAKELLDERIAYYNRVYTRSGSLFLFIRIVYEWQKADGYCGLCLHR